MYSDGNELRFTSVNLLISLLLQKVRLPEFEEEFFPQNWHLIQIVPFGSWYFHGILINSSDKQLLQLINVVGFSVYAMCTLHEPDRHSCRHEKTNVAL